MAKSETLSKTKIRWRFPFFVSAVLALICSAAWLYYLVHEPQVGGDFTLVHRQQPWNFRAHAKPLNLLYVGYVKCPDVCPMTLSQTSMALRQLSSADRERLQLAFVSVDTDHDTADSVADFALNFGPEFVGLTGGRIAIDQVVNLFQASYVIESVPSSYLGYSVAHTDRLFFLDQKGIVIDSIANPRSSEMILKKIKENL